MILDGKVKLGLSPRGYGLTTTLEEVINKLESNKYPELTYVGNGYTKADLIQDLKRIKRYTGP